MSNFLNEFLINMSNMVNFNKPIKTAKHVDLEKYVGKWYEICRLPNFFERGCTHVTAEYDINCDGTIQVVNSCIRNCKKLVTVGYATVDKNNCDNSKLWVTFPFVLDFGIPAPYLILETGIIDGDKLVTSKYLKDLHNFSKYDYALVGSPDRRFLWILSRTPCLDDKIIEQLTEKARCKFGYGDIVCRLVDSNSGL